MISTSSPFVAYCHCKVVYNGRATSTLDWGNYLILFKGDGSLSIHGGDKVMPRNYQQCNTVAVSDGNKLVFTRKRESITIDVKEMIWGHNVDDWSTEEIVISKTEGDLVKKLLADPETYFGIKKEEAIFTTEYRTDVGPLDIAIEYADEFWVVEVKRKTITYNNCVQLQKYVDHLRSKGKKVRAYIAGPALSEGGKAYCDEEGFDYIEVKFDEEHDGEVQSAEG